MLKKDKLYTFTAFETVKKDSVKHENVLWILFHAIILHFPSPEGLDYLMRSSCQSNLRWKGSFEVISCGPDSLKKCQTQVQCTVMCKLCMLLTIQVA